MTFFEFKKEHNKMVAHPSDCLNCRLIRAIDFSIDCFIKTDRIDYAKKIETILRGKHGNNNDNNRNEIQRA